MFDSGLITICELQNIAEPGMMPIEKLVPVCQAFYEEQRVGVTRSYSALSVHQTIDALVLCRNCSVPFKAEYAVTEDGTQYIIAMKQKQNDDVLLTLTRLGEEIDVISTE